MNTIGNILTHVLPFYVRSTVCLNLTCISGENLAGTIDDIRFYEEQLSDKTIKTIYYNGFRSPEGVYDLRADNDNTMHF